VKINKRNIFNNNKENLSNKYNAYILWLRIALIRTSCFESLEKLNKHNFKTISITDLMNCK